MLVRFRGLGDLGNMTCPGSKAPINPTGASVIIPVTKCPTTGWVNTYISTGRGPLGAKGQASMLQAYSYWISPAGVAQAAAISKLQQSGQMPTTASYTPGAGAAAVKSAGPATQQAATATLAANAAKAAAAKPAPAPVVVKAPLTPAPAPVAVRPAPVAISVKAAAPAPPKPAPVDMPAPGVKHTPLSVAPVSTSAGAPVSAHAAVPTPISHKAAVPAGPIAAASTGTSLETYLLLGGAAVAAYFIFAGGKGKPKRGRQ